MLMLLSSSSSAIVYSSIILTCLLCWNDGLAVVVNAFSASSGEIPARRDGAMARSRKGFGLEPKVVETNSNNIYSKPSLYDLAFGYRNYEQELEFLSEAHQTASYGNTPPRKVLELAAGPARHSLTGLTWIGSPSIVHATAVDISLDMKEYAIDLAKSTAYANDAQLRPPFVIIDTNDIDDPNDANTTPASSTFQYILQDMRHLKLDDKFDTAWILLGSMQHLLSNNDVLQCFNSIHDVLTPDGTVMIELPHPQETFAMVECTRNTWKVPLEMGRNGTSNEDLHDDNNNTTLSSSSAYLKVQWGGENDKFDPITQIRNMTVRLELVGNTPATATRISQVVPTRLFTALEIDLLARCSGFELSAMYGALDTEIPVHDPEIAYRMVCVLRKKKGV